MAFDPITMLTLAALLLGIMGALMIQSSCGARDGAALRWWGVGFLLGAIGFACVLASPTAMRSPIRVMGNAVIMLAYGAVWVAAREFCRRPVPRECAGLGALLWLAVVVLFDPGLGWRIGLSSAIIGIYSSATALEFRRDGAGRLPAQAWAAWTFAAHGTFYVLRATLGPTFGFVAWGQNIAQGWGALLGFETVMFAVVFGALGISMSRERTAQTHLREALEDNLTGIGNRRALFLSGGDLLAKAGQRPLALLMMDLDRFKRVNDRHGHDAGDRLLVAFARLAHDYLPPTSLVCRLGGEEFAAVLPGADATRARTIADELRALFAHLAIDGPSGTIGTTVSIGIAQMQAARTGMADLLERADRCLYVAKDGGRNRVVHEADDGDLRSAA